MARRRAKTDDNHAEVVKALKRIGCTVQSLAAVGRGVPDLLVGFRGVNLLMEVKDGDKPPSARKLSDSQVEWHSEWKGQKAVVESPGEAVRVVMACAR